jgi:hypothetical protein
MKMRISLLSSRLSTPRKWDENVTYYRVADTARNFTRRDRYPPFALFLMTSRGQFPILTL